MEVWRFTMLWMCFGCALVLSSTAFAVEEFGATDSQRREVASGYMHTVLGEVGARVDHDAGGIIQGMEDIECVTKLKGKITCGGIVITEGGSKKRFTIPNKDVGNFLRNLQWLIRTQDLSLDVKANAKTIRLASMVCRTFDAENNESNTDCELEKAVGKKTKAKPSRPPSVKKPAPPAPYDGEQEGGDKEEIGAP
jgi:hypothetical protein